MKKKGEREELKSLIEEMREKMIQGFKETMNGKRIEIKEELEKFEEAIRNKEKERKRKRN